MTETVERPTRTARPGRVAGYLIAIAINAVMLYLVNNLLDWEWPPFLTADFSDVLPLVNLSLAATMVVNAVWMVFDPRWFKSAAQIGLNVISFIVTVRVWQTFPFDFSPYSFDWDVVARILLVIAIIGLAIGTIAETVKLVGALVRRQPA